MVQLRGDGQLHNKELKTLLEQSVGENFGIVQDNRCARHI
jgi:hypothetical protein